MNKQYFIRRQGKRYTSNKKQRIAHLLRTTNWKTTPSVYLRATYGEALDHSGKKAIFFNDGTYKTKEDLMLAWEAFKNETIG